MKIIKRANAIRIFCKQIREQAVPLQGLIALLALCLPVFAQEPALLITDVTIIQPDADARQPNQNVLIRDGRIEAVNPTLSPGEAVTRIDGSGKFLMPGLWDMHAHVRHPLAAELIFPQFIANGVTGLREMNSECDGPQEGMPCLAQMQEWQQQIANGELLGPRLLALSSFPVNPPWDYQVTEEQIRGLVAEMDARGVDLIKTYFRLSPQAFRWLADEAASRSLPVAGHLPMQMTALEASEAGLRSLEHARDFLYDCYPGSAEFRRGARTQNPEPEVMQGIVDDYDARQCAATFETFVANDTWYVPTHLTRRMEAMAGDSAFRDDPRLVYLWPEVRDDWQADADAMVARAGDAGAGAAITDFYHKGLEITRQAHAAGVNILLGTDSGDSYSFFGFGVHDELQELVRAGLTPAEALTAATIAPARFLGLEAEYGSIEPGKVADLLLLNRDPLADIANSNSIDGVIFGGRYLDRRDLDDMLSQVQQRAN